MPPASAPENPDTPWAPQPEAGRVIARLVEECCGVSPWLRRLRQRLLDDTGTRLVDWIERLVLPEDDSLAEELDRAGFRDSDSRGLWRHERGMFPAVELRATSVRRADVRVDCVADCLHAFGITEVEALGAPCAAVREARLSAEDGVETWCVERHGCPVGTPDSDILSVNAADLQHHSERLRLRRRRFEQLSTGFADVRRTLADAEGALGLPWAVDLFFRGEREYWQSRNRAARVQKARQDQLGLGWGNHDHHTYRSSRPAFRDLMALFRGMGFVFRERFYAGREAGWGAQVLEHPPTGVVVFADVDLSAAEVVDNFALEPLAPRDELGTIGLWCRLHGEALFEAGMHHLECQFDFDAACRQLTEAGIGVMKPFTDLPSLRQAFTRGETWAIADERLESLASSGAVSAEQLARFRSEGAVGSHLEILERNDGYKGFNQAGINEILRDTDPRKRPPLTPG
ncbi:MAG: hypothetical protein KF774_02150 [Planctomyces sp.]|nr:hypothetical protein [Planctomyces sp.]